MYRMMNISQRFYHQTIQMKKAKKNEINGHSSHDKNPEGREEN